MSTENVLIGTETKSIKLPRSQVFMATHDGGDASLPYRYRSFISFSFGGKWIEDFDMIATVDGDRMSKNLMGEFEDLTSTYDVVDGQFYHGTHFKTNSISFHLSTDGIDSRKLEDFKNWFAPGKMRQLVLSEHPNRAIMARISSPPQMSMLPFEKKVEMTISGITYETSVTNFKGEILLELVMDEPFWASIINIFGKVSIKSNTNEHTYVNEWDGAVDQDAKGYFGSTAAEKSTLKDVLKIVYEDGIPLYSMIAVPMMFGDDVYAVSGGRMISKIAEAINENDYLEQEGYFIWNGQRYRGASIYNTTAGVGGVIDGAFMTTSTVQHISIGAGETKYLYYTGTAPSPVELTFTMDISAFDEEGYIQNIASNYHKINNKSYNTIVFESVEKQELRLTTPNFLTSYNNLIALLSKIDAGTAYEDIKILIRDEIRHPVIRRIGTDVLTCYSKTDDSLIINEQNKANSITVLKQMLNYQNNLASLTIIFNSKTGEAIGKFTYTDIKFIATEYDNNGITGMNYSLRPYPGTELEENVGDMLQSNYIMLKDRNKMDSNMEVHSWTASNPEYSYKVTHDFPVQLTNVSIKYKNMYY